MENGLGSRRKSLCRYTTIDDLTRDYSIDKISAYSLYPERCITGNSPTLYGISETFGKNMAVTWLTALLAAWQETVSFDKMSPWESVDLAKIIIAKHGNLKVSEIALFLSNLRGGFYGRWCYGKIQPDKIMECLRNKYLPFRTDVKEEVYKREEAKETGSTAISYEEYCRLKGKRSENIERAVTGGGKKEGNIEMELW